MGGLYDLLDPAFDHDAAGAATAASEKPASSKKRLMNDDEDEDEEIDVEVSSEEEYQYESPSNDSNASSYKSPPKTNYNTPSRRRTRSCAVPDVLKTKEVVTLDDLMKHGLLRPGIIYY
jgi:monoamine oxidase